MRDCAAAVVPYPANSKPMAYASTFNRTTHHGEPLPSSLALRIVSRALALSSLVMILAGSAALAASCSSCLFVMVH